VLESIALTIPLCEEDAMGIISLGGLILLSLEKMMVPFLRITIVILSINEGVNVTS
jgi:hypothetical protein